MATTRTIRPAADWRPAGDYEDIRYEIADGIAKITIDRPELHNAFRPETVIELHQPLCSHALERPVQRARREPDAAVGELAGAPGDRIAVERAVQERRQHEVARRPQIHAASHDISARDICPAPRAGRPPAGWDYRSRAMSIAEIRPAADWQPAGDYEDIRYETADGIAKITIDRPEVRNAFRPETLIEISSALERAREDTSVGVIILTGQGPLAFCSGGDQNVRGDTGYVASGASVGRFHVTDLHVQMRRLPKPVIAMVAGYAIGGGHVLHLVCDLTVAADNARFGQTGPKVGSFDGGYGAGLLARTVGRKKAAEIWFLCDQYDAQQALDMGLVNTVVPLAELEATTVAWCRKILAKSPLALRLLKAGLNADSDGLAGIQQLAGDATLLYYMTEEAQEGRNAFREKRRPDFAKFPRRP